MIGSDKSKMIFQDRYNKPDSAIPPVLKPYSKGFPLNYNPFQFALKRYIRRLSVVFLGHESFCVSLPVSIKAFKNVEMKLEFFKFVRFKDIACSLGYGLF